MFTNKRKIQEIVAHPFNRILCRFKDDVYKDYLAKWKMLIL